MITKERAMNQSWICPKCGRVYNAKVLTCYACNKKIDEEEKKRKEFVWIPAIRG